MGSMAVYFGSHTMEGSATVSGGVAGRRLRVRRVIITTSLNGEVQIKQDPGGPSEALILPPLQARAGGSVLDLCFDRELPQTGPGMSLGYSTTVPGRHGVWIEYDEAD